MKLHIQKELFEENLSTASRFISSKISSIQSIQGIKLAAGKETITLTTTNLNDFYHVEIAASVESEGEVVFDLKKAIEFVSLLGPGELNIETNEGSVVINQGKNKGYFNVYPTEDFPELPHIEGKEIELSKNIIEKLYLILFSSSKEETRPVLTGVFFGMKSGGGEIVSTDGFRLSLLRVGKSILELPGAIIPAHILSEVVRQAKKQTAISVILSDSEKIVKFSMGKSHIYSRVIEGEFPPYEKVVPKSQTTRVLVDKNEFLRNIKLISVFARESGDIVLFDITKEGLTLKPKTTQGNDSQAFMEHVEFEGEPLKIAFNYRYVLEFLNTISIDTVVMELTTSTAPTVFRDPKSEEYLHIIMPLRTEETTG